MLRAGMIRQLGSGTYSYLPLGLRSLNKVVGIIREEMNRAGAIEILMPALCPVEVFEKSGLQMTTKREGQVIHVTLKFA